jgi:glycosyltransferase involved in cell wall biosynthesis
MIRVLVAHNRYQQRGGEDVVVESEVNLLRSRGHEVKTYFRDNSSISSMPKISLARDTFWSAQTAKELQREIDVFHPDIIHVHNTFPLVSPSVFWAAAGADCPVVQTLHNFRLLCLQAMFLRDGAPCEKCLGHSPWRGVVHRCYHNSMAQSAVVAGMITLHRHIGTHRKKVSRYIALTEFSQQKFIEGGVPGELIRVKPNFMDVPRSSPEEHREGALFVGRLSHEKGITSLLAAIEEIPEFTLKVIGSGPLEDSVLSHPRVRYLGQLSRSDVLAEMRRTSFLIMNSLWYETFGLVLLEAFASGLPVIAPAHGTIIETTESGRLGVLFEPGSQKDLVRAIKWAQANPDKVDGMGKSARTAYLTKYTPGKNYSQLLEIYEEAIRDMEWYPNVELQIH